MIGLFHSSIGREDRDYHLWGAQLHLAHKRQAGPSWKIPGKAFSCYISSFYFKLMAGKDYFPIEVCAE
jgi:hypothetical protein